MPSCPNGHTDVWDLVCGQCKAQLPYDQELKTTLEVPVADVHFEDTTVLFIGIKPVTVNGTYVSEVTIGDEQSAKVNSLTLGKIDGGTWLDYAEKYASPLNKWMKCCGFQYSKHKMLVVNTLNPLSILALKNLLIDNRVLVLAITADKSSTSLSKNTSYVALKEAYKKELPVILIEDKYVKDLAYFDEAAGLVTGEYAFQGVISSCVNNIQAIIQFIESDKRLGINLHSMSAIISASEQVYSDMDMVFQIQSYMNSVEDSESDLQSIHLLASSPRSMQSMIEESYKKYYGGFKDLLNSDIFINDKNSYYNFYDLYFFYGLKDDPILDRIESGYSSVAKKTKTLKVDEN